jgi:hypothetical protein
MTVCPYCGADTEIKDSACVYGTSYGMVLICTRYPACDAYVGCHKAGPMRGLPKGTLANAELRNARKVLHNNLDPVWQGGYLPRAKVYKLLAVSMGIPQSECHIGMFDLDRCRKAWRHVRAMRQVYMHCN